MNKQTIVLLIAIALSISTVNAAVFEKQNQITGSQNCENYNPLARHAYTIFTANQSYYLTNASLFLSRVGSNPNSIGYYEIWNTTAGVPTTPLANSTTTINQSTLSSSAASGSWINLSFNEYPLTNNTAYALILGTVPSYNTTSHICHNTTSVSGGGTGRYNGTNWVSVDTSASFAYYLYGYSLNISGISPNQTINLSENLTQNFTVNISADVGQNVNVSWYQNTVYQFSEWVTNGLSSVWEWVIGYDDQGVNQITASAQINGSNQTVNYTFSVTIEDTYPAPNAPLSLSSASGQYEYSIPLYCKIDYLPVAPYHFEFLYGINSTTASNSLNVNDTDGFISFDISNDAYLTNYTFACRVYSPSGYSNYTQSGIFTKVNKNNFYIFRPKGQKTYQHGVPYNIGYVAELENTIDASIASTFADCNGDGLWDYGWDFRDQNVTYSRENFACVNAKGKVSTTVAMVMYKNNTYPWDALGCRDVRVSENYCAVYKTYEVTVQ